MDYEKRYKEALERAKDMLAYKEVRQEDMEYLFPELKVASDENIRKAIISCCIDHGHEYGYLGVSMKDMCAWLEKQGEQLTDKIDTKFKAGDWIVDDETPNDVFCVIEVLGEIYKVIDIDGDDYHIPHCKADKQFHIWTINDAKDGDVLVDEDNNIGLYSGEKDDLYWHSCIYLGCDDYLRGSMGYHKHENTKPATKEQRELLFQKMQEAGYEWRQEEKKLIKIKETKFKVGDWIVTDDSFGKIVRHVDEISSNIIDERYDLSDEYGLTYNLSFDNEHKWHKWTIQDASDGDVLSLISGQSIFLFDGYDKEYCHYSKLTNSFSPNFNYIGFIQHQFVPATKEQRDLLFQKMKEAGYEWDTEKKELKKIEHKTLNADKVIDWIYKYWPLSWGNFTLQVDDAIYKFKKDFGL